MNSLILKNLRKVPLLRIVAFYILGIILSNQIGWSHSYFFWIAVSLFFFSIYVHFRLLGFKNRLFFGIPLCLSIFLFGFHNTWNNNELNYSSHFENHDLTEESLLIANIQEMPFLKNGNIVFTAQISQIGKDTNNLKSVTGNLLVRIKKDSLSEKLSYGDILILQGKVSKVAPPNNPEAFHYQNYLHYQNIHYQLIINKNPWIKTNGMQANRIYSFAFQKRKEFINILRKHLPDENSFSVGSALILGYKSEMNEVIKDAYAETGAMHVLAVSGLHVGIIAGFISFILNLNFLTKIRIIRNLSPIITLLGVWSFALLTGASPSVLRASTMISFVILGKVFFRTPYIYNSLAGSALVLLIYNPYLLFSVGFQLSYLAVISIVYFQPKLNALFFVKNKIASFFWSLSLISFAAQIGTFPLSLYYFHQFPIYFWLSGLIVIPAAMILLPIGLLLLLFETVNCEIIAFALGSILHFFIKILNFLIFCIQYLPGSTIKGFWIHGFFVFLLYFSLLYIAQTINTRVRKNLIISLVFFTLTLIGMAFQKSVLINNKKIIVYDIRKKTVLDFIDRNNLYSLTSKGLNKKDIDFYCENYRFSQYINNIKVFNIDQEFTYKKSIFYIEKDCIMYYNKRIFLLDKMPQTISPSLDIDYIIVHGNPQLDIKKLTEHFHFKEIIFDGSNSTWKVKKWKKECNSLKINYHHTSEHGAWILNLNE